MVSRGAVADAVGRAVAGIARIADQLFDRAGLAPPRLDLPREVLADLESVFGDSIDPCAVVIRRGHVPRIPHSRAFALPGLIYLGTDPGIVTGDRPRATPILVHEFVHIWQGEHLGPRYVVASLLDQLRPDARPYDWRPRVAGTGSVMWSALPVEAQAQLVGDAYAEGEVPGLTGAIRRVGAQACSPAEADVIADALRTLRRSDRSRPGDPAVSGE